MTPLRRGAGPGPPPRSDEERERARLERDARRAAREGRAPAPPPAPVYEPPPEPVPELAPPLEPAPAPVPSEPAGATPPPPPAAEAAWLEPTGSARTSGTPVPEVFPPASADRLARLPSLAPPASDEPAPPLDAAPPTPPAPTPFQPFPTLEPPPPEPLLDDEVPIGTRRVRSARASGVLGAGIPSRHPRRRRPGRRWVIGLIVLFIVAVIAWFANALFEPWHGAGHGRVVVQIPPNSSSSRIGQILERNGVVSSSFFFALRARLSGKSSDLRPGRYVLRRDMPYAAAITALNTPPRAARVSAITIPEGLSIREAAPRIKAAGFRGSYLKATAHSHALTPRFYGAPKGTHSLEGFLFPATYQLRVGATVTTLVHDQVVALRRALRHVNMSYARSRHLTVYDVLTIASMVERESASPKDRRLIAAVIYNRLHGHIPLGIDATLRFALRNWTKPLTVSQLRTDSPYNTRIHLGLPPTPIGSPGLAAIRAAARPAHVGYLFYVANANGCGGTVFSSTNAKFARDVARYKAAVAANHGHVPSCKR